MDGWGSIDFFSWVGLLVGSVFVGDEGLTDGIGSGDEGLTLEGGRKEGRKNWKTAEGLIYGNYVGRKHEDEVWEIWHCVQVSFNGPKSLSPSFCEIK